MEGGFQINDCWVWGASAGLGEDGRYHLFAARWPKQLPFNNWVTNSEIVRASADDPAGPYRFEEVVLKPRSGAWDATATLNPTLHKQGGTWILYYIGIHFTDENGRDAPPGRPLTREEYRRAWRKKRIGFATAPSITGPWTRQDAPILEPRPDAWDKDLITNPAPVVFPDGSVKLLYKSSKDRHQSKPSAPLYLGLAEADHWSGPYRRSQSQPVSLNGKLHSSEDPFMWWQDDHFEAIFKDMTGEVCGERHAGVHAWSWNAREWFTAPDPLAYSRTLRWQDGSQTTQGQLERPQLLMHNGKPSHLFVATGDGPGGFAGMTRTWNIAIPFSR